MQRIDGCCQYRPRAYFAAPLFSDAERAFNEEICRRLEAWVDVYLPQRDGGLMSQMVRDGIPSHLAAHQIFRYDTDAILQADYLIAVLDGRSIDEGVAFELGVAYSHSKKCVGLQTDNRRLAPWGNNPMITGALDVVFASPNDLVVWVVEQVARERRTVSDEEATLGDVATAVYP